MLSRSVPACVALANLGCSTVQLEQKFVQGLNEYFDQPREYFFHGDHVLCMAEGVHAYPERLKWDVFFPEMELYQFAIDKTMRTVIIERKRYGEKDWVPFEPHIWPVVENEDTS